MLRMDQSNCWTIPEHVVLEGSPIMSVHLFALSWVALSTEYKANRKSMARQNSTISSRYSGIRVRMRPIRPQAGVHVAHALNIIYASTYLVERRCSFTIASKWQAAKTALVDAFWSVGFAHADVRGSKMNRNVRFSAQWSRFYTSQS